MPDPLLKPRFPGGSGIQGTIKVFKEGVQVGEYIGTLDILGEDVSVYQSSLGTVTIEHHIPLSHTFLPDGQEAVPAPQPVYDNDGNFVTA